MKIYRIAKTDKIPLTTEEREQVKARFNDIQCSFAKDKDGYYCYTHRARSKSYPSISKIPLAKVEFINSTSSTKNVIKIARTAQDIDPEITTLCQKIIPAVTVCFSRGDSCNIEGINVFLVDGDEVKLKYSLDFVEGGNDAIYNYIPANTIWIDKNLEKHEYPFIVLHEFVERYLMKEHGLEYNDAHDLANHYEKKFRISSS